MRRLRDAGLGLVEVLIAGAVLILVAYFVFNR